MPTILPHQSIGLVYSSALYTDSSVEKHFHIHYELVYVLEGEICVYADGKEYPLTEGDAILLSPLSLHAYQCTTPSLVFSAVFPDSLAKAYAEKHREETPSEPTFALPPTLRAYIHDEFFRTVPRNFGTSTGVLPKPSNESLIQLFRAASTCVERFASYERRPQTELLLLRIVDYVKKSYLADVSLVTLAQDLGYAHEHISRVLSKTLGVNFKTFVNRYRCEFATTLFSNKKLSMSQISDSCGFQSIRSFNRDFLAIYGRTPSDWRADR